VKDFKQQTFTKYKISEIFEIGMYSGVSKYPYIITKIIPRKQRICDRKYKIEPLFKDVNCFYKFAISEDEADSMKLLNDDDLINCYVKYAKVMLCE